MDIFLIKLKEARKMLHLSQVQLAESIGMAQKDVSNIESGARQYIPNQYISFLQDKGIDISTLFDADKKHVSFRTETTTEKKNVQVSSTGNSTGISKNEKLPVQKIIQSLQEPRNDYGLVPIDIVDVRAAANWEGLSMHDGELETLGTVALSTKMLQRGKIHKGFPVIGDSMVPTIVPGDYIIARFLEKNEYQDIRDGYVHLISTSSGVVVKRILNRLAERGHLWARSDNKDYVPYAIEEQDIVSIWEVKARLTFQLDDGQADVKNGYNELRARMEEIEYLLKHHKQ